MCFGYPLLHSLKRNWAWNIWVRTYWQFATNSSTKHPFGELKCCGKICKDKSDKSIYQFARVLSQPPARFGQLDQAAQAAVGEWAALFSSSHPMRHASHALQSESEWFRHENRAKYVMYDDITCIFWILMNFEYIWSSIVHSGHQNKQGCK